MKETSMRVSPDHQKGYYDEYQDGYNKAFEDFKNELESVYLAKRIEVVVRNEDYEKLKVKGGK